MKLKFGVFIRRKCCFLKGEMGKNDQRVEAVLELLRKQAPLSVKQVGKQQTHVGNFKVFVLNLCFLYLFVGEILLYGVC